MQPRDTPSGTVCCWTVGEGKAHAQLMQLGFANSTPLLSRHCPQQLMARGLARRDRGRPVLWATSSVIAAPCGCCWASWWSPVKYCCTAGTDTSTCTAPTPHLRRQHVCLSGVPLLRA